VFCGWGHLRHCGCQICKSLWAKNTRFETSRKSIIKVNQEEKEIEKMLKRPLPGERTGPVEAAFNDADFKASYPSITDHLTELRYGDGAPRVTSTLLLFCDQGVLRVCLNDRDNNRSVFFTSESIEGALLSMENALATNTVEWRSRGQNGYQNVKTPF